MSHHPLHHRRVIYLVVFLAVVAVVTTSDVVHDAFVDVLRTAESVMRAYPRAGMAIFVLLAAMSAMLSFFSSSALVPIGVFVWGPTTTGLLLWIGGVSGGSFGYWFARTLGRRIVKRLVPEAPFRRYETFFRERAHCRRAHSKGEHRKLRDHVSPLNQVAVRAKPSATENGGFQPSSRRTNDESTRSEPSSRSTNSPRPSAAKTCRRRNSGTGTRRGATPNAAAMPRTNLGVERSAPSETR